jgi:hypothetical protein
MPPSRLSVDQILRQADEFFMKTGPVHETLRDLASRLRQEDIEYAIIGGMAVAIHGYLRATQDVDVLMTREGLERFQERFAGRGYVPVFPGSRKHFRDATTNIRIEIITAGEYPGDGKAKPVVFPNPRDASVEIDGIRVATLETIIELKLASGLTAEHRTLRDLADVQMLIDALELPAELADRLNPSVRGEYIRLWNLVQRTRNDRFGPDAP